jgi:hypothetical protein
MTSLPTMSAAAQAMTTEITTIPMTLTFHLAGFDCREWA